jgi:hypothetical protein
LNAFSNNFFMYDHAEPMHAPNIAKFGRQILLALKVLRAAGLPSMRGHLHTGNVLISELAFPLSIGISGGRNALHLAHRRCSARRLLYIMHSSISHFPSSDFENVILGEPPSCRLFLDACMKRILGSVDPQAASLTMDWSPLDIDVLWYVLDSLCARALYLNAGG